MDEEQMDEPAEDPRFIPGIYNYCDRWCERCALTSRCRNYAMEEEVFDSPPSRDLDNQAFWDKLHETFETTIEMVEEEIEEMDFDLDEEELQESIREQEEVHEAAQDQPCSRTAKRYVGIVDNWLKLNEGVLGDEGDEPGSRARADIRPPSWPASSNIASPQYSSVSTRVPSMSKKINRLFLR